MIASRRSQLRMRRQKRVRKQLGRVERPLLTVFRSSKHIYAQIVDPLDGRTLASSSTRQAAVRGDLKSTKDVEAAKRVGEAIARLARERDIEEVTFNRNGFVFTGRVKALAAGAREGGLKF